MERNIGSGMSGGSTNPIGTITNTANRNQTSNKDDGQGRVKESISIGKGRNR